MKMLQKVICYGPFQKVNNITISTILCNPMCVLQRPEIVVSLFSEWPGVQLWVLGLLFRRSLWLPQTSEVVVASDPTTPERPEIVVSPTPERPKVMVRRVSQRPKVVVG